MWSAGNGWCLKGGRPSVGAKARDSLMASSRVSDMSQEDGYLTRMNRMLWAAGSSSDSEKRENAHLELDAISLQVEASPGLEQADRMRSHSKR